MKKILLSCLVGLGVGANAQFNFVGTFEDAADGYYGQFGGGTVTTAAACTGTYGGQLATSASVAQTGWMVQMEETGQITNGQKIDLKVSYKKAAGAVGSLYVAYFVYNQDSDQWSVVPVGAAISLTSAATTTCTTTATRTIPAGTIMPGQVVGFGVYYVRTSGSGNIYVDDIDIKQEVVTTVPSCTTITAPTAGSVVNAGGYEMKWTAVSGATNFKVTVGTTPGASDVYNQTLAGSVTSQYIPLDVNKNYYAKVVPSNANGDAVGCQEISFSTNSVKAYCDGAATSQQYEKISKVTFANINNSSTSTAGYEDFTSIVGTVSRGQSYPISVTISQFDADKTAVWIDYNNDGVFSDNEKTSLTSTATATGNITIPTTAALGNTRMRVRMNYNAEAPACGSTTFGQVEDYTILIKDDTMAVNDINKSNVSVYPNPFKDVLRISDVKDATSVIVSDLSGRTVADMKPATELNLSTLNKGVYIVTIKYANGEVKSTKVIKE
ncbi:GEVED domain-containing protein [Soonwooa sp.]|uniref:GEVED domain-containing protein n=1 Tax=Soonwooa sp. TaxID=1938592 RepID=UPI0028A6E709|nr:GEVED domain-containing protein [Soonwooa sp.]